MGKTMKKILCTLMVVLMCLTSVPVGGLVGLDLPQISFGTTKASALSASGSCGSNVTYTYDSDTKALTISGTGKMRDYSSGNSPFYESDIKSVVIESGVTSIGYRAFYGCTSLTSVTIGNGVTSIGSEAFYGCDKLSAVYISDIAAWCNINFSSWSSNPLYYAKSLYLKNKLVMRLTIPDTVTEIKDYAFYNCNTLLSVTIPDSVTSIGNYAFSWCTSLTSVTIPDSVTSIGDYAFRGCTGLTSVTIGNGVTSIGYRAFYNCRSLTSVTIPDSVTSIGNYAFEDCTSLTSITIPDSVTSIGNYAFYGCDKLSAVYISDIAAWSNISFSDTYSNPLCYAENLYLNGELVTDLVIPDGVANIKEDAFYNCKSITSVTIPDSVTSIGDNAFYGCTSLTSVTIGNGVTSIGYRAFYGCDKLSAVYISDIAAWSNISFSDTYSNPLYYAKSLYLKNKLVMRLTIPDTVTEIKDYAFYNCNTLLSVTIPDSVTSIGSSAFNGCTNLGSVTIPDSVTSMGDYVFRGCTNLGSVTIPDSVTSIGSSAFCDCDNLTSVTIPDSVSSIGYGAFVGCTSLTSVTIPDSVTSIGEDAFRSCTSLTSITIPDSVTSIGDYAFRGCTGLTSVTIGNGVTSIGYCAFYNCRSLTSVTIPDSVTSIGEDAFRSCTSLTSITIPDSVTSIGGSAFYNCYSLTSITIPESVTRIDSNAFSGVSKNMTVYGYADSYAEFFATTNGYKFIALCNHEETSFTHSNEIAATCTADGYTAGTYCNECERWIEGHEVIKSKGHTATDVSKKEATCLEDGYTAGTKCSVCDAPLSGMTIISKTGHNWKQTFYQAATCTKTGLLQKTCKNCGDVKSEEIKMLDHKIVAVAKVEPTCLKSGSAAGKKCDVCQTVIEGCEVLPPLGHDEKTITGTPATCTQKGTTDAVYCERCKTVIRDAVEIAALGHDFVKDATESQEATCTVDGKTVYKCKRTGCTYTETEVIKASHKGLTVIKEPTCTEAGSRGGICSVCKKDISEILPATGHKEVKVAGKEATCEMPGLTDGISCYYCGYEIKAQEVIPAGHTYDKTKAEVVKEATCIEEGTIKYKCTKCTKSVTEKTEKLPHTEVEIPAKPNTCTENGNKAGIKCSVCDAIIKEATILKAEGHNWVKGEDSKDPTCTEPGYLNKTCTRCGERQTGTVDATGHKNTEVIPETAPDCINSGISAGIKCKDCGAWVQERTTLEALGHDWILDSTKSTPSTCTTKGLNFYNCSRCKQTNSEEVALISHAWGSWITDVEATCQTSGTKHRECASCKLVETATIPKAACDIVPSEYVAPTCTTSGYTGGTHCTKCNTVYEAPQEIPALGHDWESWFTQEPTCTEEGVLKYCCSICSESRIEKAPATGHSYPNAWSTIIEPTCTDKGVKIKICFACHGVLAETMDKTDHIDKNKDKLCDDCGSNVKDTIDEHEHAYGDWSVSKEPTHTEDGLKTKACKICGDVLTEPIEKTKEHTYAICETVAPTCTVDGKAVYKCKYTGCTYTKTEVIKASHKGLIDMEAPTCTEAGSRGGICSVCKNNVSEVIPATGHKVSSELSWKVKIQETCTKDGLMIATCDTCGDEVTKVIPATGHKEVKVVGKEPTCNMPGLTDGIRCYYCAYEIKAQEVIPAGHTYDKTKAEVVKEASCKEEGTIKYKCTKCAASVTEKTEKLPHTEVKIPAKHNTCTKDGNEAGIKCSVCNAIIKEATIIKATGHNWVKGKDSKDPTCTEAGYLDHACTICDERRTSTIPATGHIDSNSDSYCDFCGLDLNPQAHCSCDCHKTGITKFFFTIINFFEKLFGNNKVCACGAIH